MGLVATFTLSLAALLLTLALAALLVYGSDSNTDEIFLFLFPTLDNLPESLNLQAWGMAFSSYLALSTFWIALANLLPLPGMDSFIILFSLMTHFRETQEQKGGSPQEQLANDSPQNEQNSNPPQHRSPINQYKRRNNVSDIHFKIGAEYHASQLYDDAIARYRQAIQADQFFGPAYVNLGLAYAAKGKRREAIHAFRGAIQYADDQKSQSEAWYQLHQLSEVSPVNMEEAEEGLSELGAEPWTDTKPKPNWIGLGISSALILVTALILYTYLFTHLVEMLNA